MIKKFNSPNAIINLLGPFTISQMLMNAAEEQMLADKTFRKYHQIISNPQVALCIENIQIDIPEIEIDEDDKDLL